MAPLISFLITVYNGEEFLTETVRGLLAIDWPEFEVVVVDDGSNDRSAEIVETLAREDSRIRFQTLGRVGRAQALNRGVAIAAGDYIAINDADDYSLPHRLQATVDLLDNSSSISFVAGRHEVVPDDQWSTYEKSWKRVTAGEHRFVTARHFYKSNPIVHSAVIFPKAKWRDAGGYNENLTSCIDYEFYFRLLGCGAGVQVDDVVVLHRKRFDTIFKKRSTSEYVANLRAALHTARERCHVPLRYRIYDIKPYALVARHAWNKRRHRSTSS